MTRPILLASCALLTLGCGEKKPAASSGDAADESPAAEEAPAASSTLPQDKTSQAFVDTLVAMAITRFVPTDDGVLKYDTLSFSADERWVAGAAVEIMDERMECSEGGSWSMDPATSKDEAALTWTVESTTCAGRESGEAQRVLVDLSGGTFKVSFR